MTEAKNENPQLQELEASLRGLSKEYNVQLHSGVCPLNENAELRDAVASAVAAAFVETGDDGVFTVMNKVFPIGGSGGQSNGYEGVGRDELYRKILAEVHRLQNTNAAPKESDQPSSTLSGVKNTRDAIGTVSVQQQ